MVTMERSERQREGQSGPIRAERHPTVILALKHKKTIFTLGPPKHEIPHNETMTGFFIGETIVVNIPMVLIIALVTHMVQDENITIKF